MEVERSSDGRVRRRPGTEFEVDADLVLLAIGFAGPVRDRLLEDLKLEFGERGAIVSDDRYGTGAPGVFVAGDARRGASLIVWAIAEGRKAARQADLYLMGESRLPP